MDIKEKYHLDDKLLERIERRVQTPNGNKDMDLLIPLVHSVYGHLREQGRQIMCIKENPLVWLGEVIKDKPVFATFIGMCLLIIVVLLHNTGYFPIIMSAFGVDIPIPTVTPIP